MRIGDVVIHAGRPVILLGVEPMSVPERIARVRDVATGDDRDVPYEELRAAEGLSSNG